MRACLRQPCPLKRVFNRTSTPTPWLNAMLHAFLSLFLHIPPHRERETRQPGTLRTIGASATDDDAHKGKALPPAATFVPSLSSLSSPPAAPCPPPNPGSTHRRQPRGCAGTLTRTVRGRGKGATTSFLLRIHIRPTTRRATPFFKSPIPSSLLVLISLRVHNHDAACVHVTGGGDKDKECRSRPRSWDGGVAAPGSSCHASSCFFLLFLLLLLPVLFLQQQQYQQYQQ